MTLTSRRSFVAAGASIAAGDKLPIFESQRAALCARQQPAPKKACGKAQAADDHGDDQGREQMGLLQGRVKRMHDLIDGILGISVE